MNIKDTLEASCYKLVYPQIDKFNVQLFNFIDTCVNSLGSLTLTTFNLYCVNSHCNLPCCDADKPKVAPFAADVKHLS